MLDTEQITSRMDLALLHANVARHDVEKACALACKRRFRAVCVAGSRVLEARHFLGESDVKTVCVIGFPFGGADADAKRYEAEAAVDSGAQEIELVLGPGRFHDRDDGGLLRETRDVIESAQGVPVGVLLDCILLDEEEKRRAGGMISEARAGRVVLAGRAARDLFADVEAFREQLGASVAIKTLAALNDLASGARLIDLGASQLGVFSQAAFLNSAGGGEAG